MDHDPGLRWRLRRGLKELDVLLERYYQRRYAGAQPAAQQAFARLLEREDPEIQQWLLQQAPVPAEFEDVVKQLRRHD